MHLLVLLSVIVVAVLAGCVCPDGNCSSYKGSMAECYCFCTLEAAKLHTGADSACNYSGGSSSKKCSLCSSSIKTAIDFPSLAEQTLASKDQNNDVVFPVYNCVCPDNDCSSYHGSKAMCEAWAKSKAQDFIGSYKVFYISQSSFSAAKCSVCGGVNPCEVI
ncbi:hypothetical protein RCL1_004109 [Eukaryota sp. TZLM3-RCL]